MVQVKTISSCVWLENEVLGRTAFLVMLLFLATSAYPQDSTRSILVDTLKTVSIGQYGKLDMRVSSAYIRKFDYSTSLSTSSGISIFNALRGRIPGLSIPSYFASANSSGIRTGPYPSVNDALVVIDGVPFNNYIGNYLNLNAFDYESIAAISSTGAINFLGGANSGAFVLSSKSGKGFKVPSFEFNSYATYGWDEFPSPFGGQAIEINEWYLTNSLAYNQDFGKMDARISYSLQKKWYQEFGEPYIHYLKTNLGFALTPRLDLRLIVDGRYSKYDDMYPSGGPSSGEEEKQETYLSGNLLAKYKLKDWLFLTSQFGLTNYHSNTTVTQQSSGNEKNRSNGFSQANFVATVQKQVGKVGINGFVGIQIHTQTIDLSTSAYGTPFDGTSESNWRNDQPQFIGQVNFGYNKWLNLSAGYQDGTHTYDYNVSNVIGSSTTHASGAGAAGFSIIFSEWFRSRILNFGKLRANLGSHTVVPKTSYPTPEIQVIAFRADDVSNLEAGLDLEFMKSRLHTTINYYQNQETYPSSQATKYLTTGWEADVRFDVIKKEKINFESSLVVSNATWSYELDGGGINKGGPFSRIGWWNEVKFGSFQVGMLIESINNFTGYSIGFGLVPASFSVLRDISFSVKLPNTRLLGLETRNVTLSIVGRNLARIDRTGPDVDVATGLVPFRKSASLNLNLTF